MYGAGGERYKFYRQKKVKNAEGFRRMNTQKPIRNTLRLRRIACAGALNMEWSLDRRRTRKEKT